MQNFRKKRTETSAALRAFLRDEIWPSDAELFTYDQIRLGWRECRGEILARWVVWHPGSRPKMWWRFDAPEPRRHVDDTSLVESQAAYLQRHNLLGAVEFQRLKPGAFHPERLADQLPD